MKNKILYLISLILCAAIAFSSCVKGDAENTSGTKATSQTSQSTSESFAANAEPIALSAGERLLSSSVFKGKVHLGGNERECFVRSAVILNEKLPFGAVMYLDVLDENGDILIFRKCSGYGFIAADMSKETPSKFLFYSVVALENGMFEAKTELISFDDRDRLTAESTGTLAAYHQGAGYSFNGDAGDELSMVGCAESFKILSDRTLDFLNSEDFEMLVTSIPTDEDLIDYIRELDVEKFKTLYEKIIMNDMRKTDSFKTVGFVLLFTKTTSSAGGYKKL